MNQFSEFSVKTETCKPWLDYDDPMNSLFISLHGYDDDLPENFYPSSGNSHMNTNKKDNIYPGGILNIPITKESNKSHAYRNLFRLKVMPRLNKFKPDIIFISAGFDGHENEEMNLGYMKLVNFNVKNSQKMIIDG